VPRTLGPRPIGNGGTEPPLTGGLTVERTPDDSLRKIIRTLQEEAAALAGRHSEVADWFTRMADHLMSELSA